MAPLNLYKEGYYSLHSNYGVTLGQLSSNLSNSVLVVFLVQSIEVMVVNRISFIKFGCQLQTRRVLTLVVLWL